MLKSQHCTQNVIAKLKSFVFSMHPFQAETRLTVSSFHLSSFWPFPCEFPIFLVPFLTLSFFVYSAQHVSLWTTGKKVLWSAGFHTAMVCLRGDDSLQICTKELLHPQRVCDQDSWHRRSAADLVSAHLENSLCLFHHRSVQREICCKPDLHIRQENQHENKQKCTADKLAPDVCMHGLCNALHVCHNCCNLLITVMEAMLCRLVSLCSCASLFSLSGLCLQ